MCVVGQTIERVKIQGCSHGSVHVNIGGMTLHLRPDELVLLSRVVNTWLLRHPRYLATTDETHPRSLQDEGN